MGFPNKDPVFLWLLEENNPPVRFLTLKNLLKCSPDDSHLNDARLHLMEYSVTQGILDHFDSYISAASFSEAYSKYRGLYWQAIFLGQFLADREHPKIRQLANWILSDKNWIIKTGGQCLTANILRALTSLGYGSHPTAVKEREALAERIVGEDGIKCAAVDYSPLRRCYMAQPKLLLCFAQVPVSERSENISKAIEILVRSLVENEIFIYLPGRKKEWAAILEKKPKSGELKKGVTIKAWIEKQREIFLRENENEPNSPKDGWTKFGFPLHYNSDILEALYALSLFDLSLLDLPVSGKLESALQVVREKQTEDGRWLLENSLNGKMWVDVEEKGKPSKWITYHALYILNHFQTGIASL
jgi:hypothetical protein